MKLSSAKSDNDNSEQEEEQDEEDIDHANDELVEMNPRQSENPETYLNISSETAEHQLVERVNYLNLHWTVRVASYIASFFKVTLLRRQLEQPTSLILLSFYCRLDQFVLQHCLCSHSLILES